MDNRYPISLFDDVFSVNITWNTDDMSQVSSKALGGDRDLAVSTHFEGRNPPILIWGYRRYNLTPESAWTSDVAWGVIALHCEREGVSSITLTSPWEQLEAIVLVDDEHTYETYPDKYEAIINQRTPRQLIRDSGPVGGFLTSANRFLVLTPYIALIGLIGVFSTVYLYKKKKNRVIK